MSSVPKSYLLHIPAETFDHIQHFLLVKECTIIKRTCKAFDYLLDEVSLKNRARDLHWIIQPKENETVLEVFKRLFPLIQNFRDTFSSQKAIEIRKPDFTVVYPSFLQFIIDHDQSLLLKDLIDGNLNSINSVEISGEILAGIQIQKERLGDFLGNVFCTVIENGSKKCVEVIINNSWFPLIRRNNFLRAFSATAELEHENCMELIVRCSIFSEIPAEDLENVFLNLARHGCVSHMKVIIDCSRFCDIDTPTLNQAFRDAFLNGREASVKTLQSCSRSDEITGGNFRVEFLKAVRDGDADQLKLLCKDNKFDQIPTEDLNQSSSHMVVQNDVNCLKVLMSCTRFNEIEPVYLSLIQQRISEMNI